MAERIVTTEVAVFAADQGIEVPAAVEHAVRRAILDSVGVSVAGTRHPASQKVIQMIAKLGLKGPCHLIGSSQKTDPVNAALSNGVTAHVLDWDDTILPTRAHLGAVLLPPLAAAGQIEAWTIQEIIPAFAVGFEIQARLNHAVYPSIHLRGWQGTGVVGGIGAAAAVGRMLKLNAAQIAHAMGIAASNASGLIATFGSMTKSLNLGRAGATGLQSAYLAQLGFTSARDILGEGRFLEIYDDNPRYDLLLEDLGKRWAILDNGYKPYPCGFVAHAMIDAVRDLRGKVAPDEVLEHLSLTVSPESTHLMGNPDPRNELEAKFSLLYEAAVAWVDGNVTPASFVEAAVRDERYRKIMAVTEITAKQGVAQHEAFAEAIFQSGRVEKLHVPHARGTQERPLTDEDLLEKFKVAFEIGEMPGADELAGLIMEGRAEPVARIYTRLNSEAASGA